MYWDISSLATPPTSKSRLQGCGFPFFFWDTILYLLDHLGGAEEMIWGPIYRPLYHFFLRALPSWETSFWHLWIGKYMHAWVLAKSLQLCPALCNPMDCIAWQAPLSMEFSRQEYWSGLPFPSPGHLPDPGIKPRSLALQADSLPSEPPGKPIIYNHMHT